MANVTMADVAQRIGISRAAVSYALNGRARDRGISSQLERRILRTAQEMGYRPSRLAQSLARQRTNTLGLILPDMGATYGPVLTESLETSARRGGYQVLLAHHGGDLDRFRDAVRTMLEWHVDGLAVVPLIGPNQQAAMNELEDLSVPVALIERDIVNGHGHVIVCDVERATRMAMEHLLMLGHRRIALFDGPHELRESHAREGAYRRQLHLAGIACDPCLIFVPELTDLPQRNTTLIERMLDLPDRPSAAVVVSGDRAISLYKVCRRRGLSIPGDLSVVALTGMTFDEFSRVQFTSARLTYGEVGRSVFQLLQHDIEHGRTPPRRVLTSPQWVDGQSTAAVEAPQ